MNSKLLTAIFLALTISISISGCFLAPAIDSFNRLGMTEGDRMTLLGQQVKKFQDAVYWGTPSQILAFASDEARTALADQLRARSDDERVVESKVLDMQFREEANLATVQIKVRFFKVPFYVLNDRYEEQEWRFKSISSGWEILSRQVVAGPKK